MTKERYESWSRATTFILIVVGIAGIVFVPAFWALTDRIEIALLPFFATMAGVGQGLNVLQDIRQNPVSGGGVTNGNGGAGELGQPETGTARP